MGLPLRGSDFGTQLPHKTGPLRKPLIWPPPLEESPAFAALSGTQETKEQKEVGHLSFNMITSEAGHKKIIWRLVLAFCWKRFKGQKTMEHCF